MEDFDRNFLLGIIFDLSNFNTLNTVKDSLIKYLVDAGMASRMYVWHPDWQMIPRDQGESVYYVASYKQPTNFNIGRAFKEIVTLIGERNEDCGKYILLITDNFQAPQNQQYRKAFLANTIRDYKSKILVFGLPNCDRKTLEFTVKEYDSQYFDLDNPSEINLQLSKILEE